MEDTQVENETIADTTEGGQADAGQDTAAGQQADDRTDQQQTESVQSQSTGSAGGAGSGAIDAGANAGSGVDPLESEFTKLDELTTKYETGELTLEQYNRQYLAGQKKITKAQQEFAQQAQEPIKQQKAVQAYWNDWTNGQTKDVAQLQYGKTVTADRASVLYKEAQADVSAHPRYKNRKEMDIGSIIYDKWMDKLEAESKKKPVATNASQSARVTGSAGAANTVGSENLTTREKAARGDYGDLTKLI